MSIENVSIFDFFATNVRVDVLNNKILRLLPIIKNEVQDEWISNITRYFYDSIYYQRLTYPILKKDGNILKIS